MAKAAKKKIPSKKKSGSNASKGPAKVHAQSKAKPEKQLGSKAKKAVEILKKLAAKTVKQPKKAAPEKKPAKSAAPAKPVKEFNKEITTGMSAPPIGNTNNTP